MWLATKLGFFSVVCAKEVRDGEVSEVIDTDTVMIRARWREHLIKLRQRFPRLGFIQKDLGTDYRWRIICPKGLWASMLAELVLDQDYPNFKHACEETHGSDSPYMAGLRETWMTFFKLGAR